MRQELYGLGPVEESEVGRDEKNNFSGLGRSNRISCKSKTGSSV